MLGSSTRRLPSGANSSMCRSRLCEVARHGSRGTPRRQPDQRIGGHRYCSVQRAPKRRRSLDVILRRPQVREFFLAYRADRRKQAVVARREEMQLVVEMAVYSGFDRRRGRPNCLPAEESCGQPEYATADTPQEHHTARARTARRHGSPKLCAVLELVAEHPGQCFHHIGIKSAREGDLSSINANGSVLAGMIDFHDPCDRQRFIGRQRHATGELISHRYTRIGIST